MTGDDLERQLREAFEAQARSSVGEHASPPAPRFAQLPAPSSRRRTLRWAAPLAAAAAVVAIVGTVLGLSSSSPDHHTPAAGASTPRITSGPNHAVHVKLLNDDGATYGVAMPVVIFLSQPITDARAMQAATVATVNGHPVQGAWYFEQSADPRGAYQAHYRLVGYWPANATVQVSMPFKGLPAGGALRYDDSLTTTFRTGPDVEATVDQAKHDLVITSNDQVLKTFPVSVGPATRRGVKVIMEKPGDVPIEVGGTTAETGQHAMRLTYGGEYILGAPWAVTDIARHVDASGGSTLLTPADATQAWRLLGIGDPVTYADTNGTPMAIGSGYGDWNVQWAQWLTGGLVPTH